MKTLLAIILAGVASCQALQHVDPEILQQAVVSGVAGRHADDLERYAAPVIEPMP